MYPALALDALGLGAVVALDEVAVEAVEEETNL